jgi:hypothetical protein
MKMNCYKTENGTLKMIDADKDINTNPRWNFVGQIDTIKDKVEVAK